MSSLDFGSLLASKARGVEMSVEQIRWFIEGVSDGSLSDARVAAMCTAVFANGLSPSELLAFCDAMIDSGSVLSYGKDMLVVDKHSTGGVGDNVSIVLAPLCAALGLSVPMLSGRGLGHTGGTLDKLEAIAGFDTALSAERAGEVLREVGCFISGASADLAPADARLYAIRDHIGAVAQRDLIAASIMSKKLAAGSPVLLLDVKYGSGAFCASPNEAVVLAETAAGLAAGRGVAFDALISDMGVVCGSAVGNAPEILEALDVLSGRVREGPVVDLVVQLAARASVLAGSAVTQSHVRRLLGSGAAYDVFDAMVTAQGGSLTAVAEPTEALEVVAAADGWMCAEAYFVGAVVHGMGAGRTYPGAPVDVSAGVTFSVPHGSRVSAGDILGVAQGADASAVSAAALRLGSGLVSDAPPADPLGPFWFRDPGAAGVLR